MTVHFFTDARAFLDAAADVIARNPLQASVIASTAERYVDEPMPDWAWFAVIAGDGDDHLAMRTHPEEPHAGFVTTMPPAAVHGLADALEARGETVAAWNGDLDGALALCRRAVPGEAPRVAMHTRMFEIRTVRFPMEPAGVLRRATLEDVDLLAEWTVQFHADSEVQGGRPVPPELFAAARVARIRESVERRIDHGGFWIWEVDGVPVHMTGSTPAGPHSMRIGPVYTPVEHRGHGYAGWVVATVSQMLLDAGNRVCLYTDQANPVSNKVYERIGYERIADEGNVVTGGAPLRM